MPLVCATPLPAFAAATHAGRLRALCERWERQAGPRLSPRALAHCRRFAPVAGGAGDALRARASRLIGRLLALRALPEDALLDMDAEGRPLVRGSPGWTAAFTHSGRAAFCLICAPGEAMPNACGAAAVDAEARAAPAPTDRAFAAPAPGTDASLRRWVLAESMFKALGASPHLWGAVAAAAHEHASERAGAWEAGDERLCWQFLAAPGHILCVTLPGAPARPMRLRWLPWQCLA